MKKYNSGLIVGKFAPMHKGHKYLIDTALEQCERVIIIAYSNPDLGVTPEEKIKAFRRVFEGKPIDLIVPFSNMPLNSASEFQHRMFCVTLLEKKTFEVVFSSEEYGPPFAIFLTNHFGHEIAHVMVDLKREKFPISATRIRNENLKEWMV